MVSEEKMYEEIDRATEAITVYNMIDLYDLLINLKYADNFQKKIEEVIKWTELKLQVFGVDIGKLKAIDEGKKEKMIQIDNKEICGHEVEIPPYLLANLITWMRSNGISETEIVNCILHICSA